MLVELRRKAHNLVTELGQLDAEHYSTLQQIRSAEALKSQLDSRPVHAQLHTENEPGGTATGKGSVEEQIQRQREAIARDVAQTVDRIEQLRQRRDREEQVLREIFVPAYEDAKTQVGGDCCQCFACRTSDLLCSRWVL